MSEGLSETVTIIILVAVAITLTIAIAVWVFGIAGNASRSFGVRVMIEGPSMSQNNATFIIINSGTEYVELAYIIINNVDFVSSNRCAIPPGNSALLTIISNGTHYVGAALRVGNCTVNYNGDSRIYGINTAEAVFTNGQQVLYETLNLQGQ
ncbi:hypothetical protein [Vulcanisaeta sp. JCM 16159]|uniref:hypothetical protein n=1 Tax=Vulcanisaeta sp. JCM 16159 TaxID=1295371 RepID=UPI0006D2BCB9|nr:hypothetical protein [Vulcanisaeta sp. JCM 16159]